MKQNCGANGSRADCLSCAFKTARTELVEQRSPSCNVRTPHTVRNVSKRMGNGTLLVMDEGKENW